MGHNIMLISMNIFHAIDYHILICFGMMFSIVCTVEADEIAFQTQAKNQLLVKH